MLTRLKLDNFKSFKSAELELGPFTVLVGANATGKSNVREAFRFLHGIARGYPLPGILDEWAESSGEEPRPGIRGGLAEAFFQKSDHLSVGACVSGVDPQPHGQGIEYRMSMGVKEGSDSPIVRSEHFLTDSELVWESGLEGDHLWVKGFFTTGVSSGAAQPALGNLPNQLLESHGSKDSGFHQQHEAVLGLLTSMRFFDFSLKAMREPATPGHQELGDSGEFLSSVLKTICDDPDRKQTLSEWLQELTPMDVCDLKFPPGHGGRVLLSLVEEGGQQTSADSASDGTLRFLAILSALLSPKPSKFLFFEELENGIHPTRLALLLDLIEQRVKKGDVQVVATTHSPHLLAQLSPESLEHASVTYRLEGQPDTRIKRILDIPQAREVIEKQDLASLHSSGWLEDVLHFTEAGEEDAK